MNSPSLVTASIPYVNAHPHIGFALELVQADVIARWHRLQGRETLFLTGTDDNALKNVRAAAKEGLAVRDFCDRNAGLFQDLLSSLNISADRFIRTSSEAHFRGASRFWGACRKEDIYTKRYRGLYCVGCEDFCLEKDLRKGLCPTHGTRPEVVEEQNYFFRLSAYERTLEELIVSGTLKIAPESRRNEALGFIRHGLLDFSTSRVRERSAGWGIPVPGDPTQVIYVWFDALVNYLTGLGYGTDERDFERFWLHNSSKTHVIGKDILRFHAVYWPAMLLSAGLPLPETVWAHGFVTVEGEKISKCQENAVDPFPLIERYGADALRYYLLRAIPASSDGDFSMKRFGETYRADLSDGLGNLVLRVEALCERTGFEIAQPAADSLPESVSVSLSAFRFQDALREIWDRVRELNQSVQNARPWNLLKGEEKTLLNSHLPEWVASLRTVACCLRPFLPHTAEEIQGRFSAGRIRRGEPLFPRK